MLLTLTQDSLESTPVISLPELNERKNQVSRDPQYIMYDLSEALCNLETELERINTFIRELSDVNSEHAMDVLVPLDVYEQLVEDAHNWANRPGSAFTPPEIVRTVCSCAHCSVDPMGSYACPLTERSK